MGAALLLYIFRYTSMHHIRASKGIYESMLTWSIINLFKTKQNIYFAFWYSCLTWQYPLHSLLSCKMSMTTCNFHFVFQPSCITWQHPLQAFLAAMHVQAVTDRSTNSIYWLHASLGSTPCKLSLHTKQNSIFFLQYINNQYPLHQ